jgi:23S rRNA (pseudouridine1915-N3)-methyltransferase
VKVTICAVGRLRAGPEKALAEDYLDRFSRTGRPMGLGPGEIRETEDRRGGGKAAEAALLAALVPAGAVVVALDERGGMLTSPGFAALLAKWRDEGRRDLAFLIGGADGLDAGLVAKADMTLGLGAMVWPHLLVRVMLAEQLYRAAGILAGTPYHRA